MQTVGITIKKKGNYSIIHCIWSKLKVYLAGEKKEYKQTQALKYHLLPWIKVFLISMKSYY